MVSFRIFEERDWSATWRIIKPVFRAGETYPFSPDITEEEAFELWVTIPTATFVAVNDSGDILGSYYIKPNQHELGAHVCNCGYVVAESARGRGIGSLMCGHSLTEAAALGFRAMQYNMVVATNEAALRTWEKHGFEVIGRLPGAFRHRRYGYVDACVMYRQLAEE